MYAGNEKIFADVPPSHPGTTDRIMTAYTAGIMNGSYVATAVSTSDRASASRNHVAKMTANLLGHLNKGTRTASSPSGRDPHDKPAG